ncbi:MAG: Nif3-like dinuclear metal center hexameric protein [Halolamina sp.]
MELRDFVDRLDDELRTDDWADLDASPNGLQVGTSDGEVDRVAVAVDAAVATVEAAVAADADVLVTHHGVVFGGLDRVTGREYDRLAPLVEADLPLYVSHLPLDGHQTLGNAAGLGDFLGLTDDRDPFGELGPEHVGQRGRFETAQSPETVRDRLDELDQGPRSTRHLDFGPDRIEEVAVVTGSGVDWLDEAVAAGADALVTGEGKQQAYHEAREAGVHVYLAGHYATEVFGVRRLAERAAEWGLETTVLDHPTGL